MELDYSDRKGRDGQKKKIGKANERKGKVKRGIMSATNRLLIIRQGSGNMQTAHSGNQLTALLTCQ